MVGLVQRIKVTKRDDLKRIAVSGWMRMVEEGDLRTMGEAYDEQSTRMG